MQVLLTCTHIGSDEGGYGSRWISRLPWDRWEKKRKEYHLFTLSRFAAVLQSFSRTGDSAVALHQGVHNWPCVGWEDYIVNANGFVCPRVRMRASNASMRMKMGFPSVSELFLCIYLFIYVCIQSCLFHVTCMCYVSPACIMKSQYGMSLFFVHILIFFWFSLCECSHSVNIFETTEPKHD